MSPTEAPISNRGCVIHLLDDAVYTVMPRRPLRAQSWDELRQMIDEELQHDLY